MATLAVRKVADLDADKARYKLQGFKGTAAANTDTNIDWKLTEDRWISGGVLSASLPSWGDCVSLQVIDIDNILGYGSNVVLDEYVSTFYLTTDSQLQIQIESPYIALIPKNLYIRIIYHNTSDVNSVEVALNLTTHIPRL